MTITKLHLIRRLLLQLVAMIEGELRERGALPQVGSARDVQHW